MHLLSVPQAAASRSIWNDRTSPHSPLHFASSSYFLSLPLVSKLSVYFIIHDLSLFEIMMMMKLVSSEFEQNFVRATTVVSMSPKSGTLLFIWSSYL
jgi:hypothetical protein